MNIQITIENEAATLVLHYDRGSCDAKFSFIEHGGACFSEHYTREQLTELINGVNLIRTEMDA